MLKFCKNWCVESFFLRKASRDPIGGTNFAFFGTAFGQSGSSRAPIVQFLGSVGKPPNFVQKAMLLQGFGTFLGDFSCLPTGPRVVPKLQNWCPTGSRLDP